jgi:hypothetical protein
MRPCTTCSVDYIRLIPARKGTNNVQELWDQEVDMSADQRQDSPLECLTVPRVGEDPPGKPWSRSLARWL